MALQGTGAIKYSQIQEEFGVAYPDASIVNWTQTYNDYNGDYYTVYDEFSAPSGNWVELPFSWVTLYDDFSAPSGNFVSIEDSYSTIFEMGYTAGQNYLQFFQGVFTIFYEGIEIGQYTTIPTQIGNRKYYGGNLAVDNGNTFINPSYYELKVEELVSSYVFRYNWQIVGSNADGGVLESGAFKYTRGSQIYDLNKYAIKVEEYKADEVNGTYTYKYGFNDVATSTSTSVTSGTYRYSRGDVRFQGVYDDPSPKNRYVIKVENSPTTYLKEFGDSNTEELVYTVVYQGIELGTLDGGYLTIGNRRYYAGDRVVDGGSLFVSPSYYKLIIETSDADPSFGNYRVSEQFGSVTLPLDSDAGANNDTDIPGPGNPIKFSNFYNARLNVVVDYYKTNTLYPEIEYRQIVRDRYNLNDKTSVIGGFKGRPDPSGSDSNTGGSKVIIVVDKKIGSSKLNPDIDDMTQQSKICALRTGNQWSSGTRMRIEVGNSGKIIGAGGNGGQGGSAVAEVVANAGGDGGDGSGALGIEYGTDSNPTIVRVKSSGRIITGYGGGGGGGGAFESENRPHRSVSGGGGGGGAGLPVGLKGVKDQSSGSTRNGSDGRPNQNQCNASNPSNDGSEPNDGEQGGEGAQVETTTNRTMFNSDGVTLPFGTPVLMGGNSCNSEGEAISGAGGNGRDQTVAHTPIPGLEEGEGGSGLASRLGGVPSEGGAGAGGDAGLDGGAVRRSEAAIKWKFDTDHVVESVFGSGKNVTPLDISESPTGVS